MITQWLLDALVTVFSWLCSNFPTFTVPDFLSSVQSGIASINGDISGMDAWIPLSDAVAVTLAVVGVFAAALAIKVLRIVASFLTLGGGGAG